MIRGLLMKIFLRLNAFLLCIVLLGGCANPGGTVPEANVPTPETPGPTEAHPATDAPFPETAAPVGAVRVVMTRDDGEGEKVLFEGQDANGAVVWQRIATTQHRTELTLIEEISVWEDRYYYTRAGVVCCLRLSDGSLMWENGEFGGSSISSLIDQRNGNVYLCGWYGPDFFACDKNGETLCKFASAGDFFCPSNMNWREPDSLVRNNIVLGRNEEIHGSST